MPLFQQPAKSQAPTALSGAIENRAEAAMRRPARPSVQARRGSSPPGAHALLAQGPGCGRGPCRRLAEVDDETRLEAFGVEKVEGKAAQQHTRSSGRRNAAKRARASTTLVPS